MKRNILFDFDPIKDGTWNMTPFHSDYVPPKRKFSNIDPYELMPVYPAYDARLRCEAGDAIAGYKVGAIGPGVLRQFGVKGPVFGHILESEISEASDPPQHGDFCNLAIEGEMAVRIGPDGKIAEAFPIIELHHFCFRAEPLSLAELIANNAINAGLVMSGPDASLWPRRPAGS